jgi:hypothetical protein
MAKQNRTILKTYFNTGDIPVESNYVDLIDSNLNLSENNTGDINLTGNITASGNISASGTIISNVITPTTITNVDTTHITASGNISAGGNISASSFKTTGLNITGNAINSISNGNIFFLVGSNGVNFEADNGDLISFNTVQNNVDVNMFGENDNKLFFLDASADKIGIGTNTPGEKLEVIGNISASGNFIVNEITASGNISSSGRVFATHLKLNQDGPGNGTVSSIYFGSTPSLGGRIYDDTNGFVMSYDDGDVLKVGANTTEITNTLKVYGSGGDVMIGANAEPGEKLEVVGNISASGNIIGGVLYSSDIKLVTTIGTNILDIGSGGAQSINLTNITASGNISASGIINAQQLNLSNQHYADFNGTVFRVGASAPTIHINDFDVNDLTGNSVFLDASSGNITASGNISASGTITSLSSVAGANYNLNHLTNTATFNFNDGVYDLGGRFGNESAILTITNVPAKNADGVIGEFIFLNRAIPQGTVILTTTNSNVVAIPFEQTSTQFKLGFKASPTRDFSGGNVVISITYLMPS